MPGVEAQEVGGLGAGRDDSAGSITAIDARLESAALTSVRKTTGGSRSWDGARSLAVLASCQQSLVRNGQDWLALLRTHVTSPASCARLASVLAD